MLVARLASEFLISIFKYERILAIRSRTPRNITLFIDSHVEGSFKVFGVKFLTKNAFYIQITALLLAFNFWTFKRKPRIINLTFEVNFEAFFVKHMLTSLQRKHFIVFLFMIIFSHTNLANLTEAFIILSTLKESFFFLLDFLNQHLCLLIRFVFFLLVFFENLIY